MNSRPHKVSDSLFSFFKGLITHLLPAAIHVRAQAASADGTQSTTERGLAEAKSTGERSQRQVCSRPLSHQYGPELNRLLSSLIRYCKTTKDHLVRTIKHT
jgi:hypothetical protein